MHLCSRSYIVSIQLIISRKVAGSIHERVAGIFHWLNPSGSTLALVQRSTPTLTEMSTRSISWGQRRPVRRADKFATFICRLSRNSESLSLLEPQESGQAFTGRALPYIRVYGGGVTERKRPLGRPWREWSDTVKVDHEELGWEVVDWISVVEYRDIQKAVVHRAM